MRRGGAAPSADIATETLQLRRAGGAVQDTSEDVTRDARRDDAPEAGPDGPEAGPSDPEESPSDAPDEADPKRQSRSPDSGKFPAARRILVPPEAGPKEGERERSFTWESA